MTAGTAWPAALMLRPVEGLLLAGGATCWARTVAEAELLLRRHATDIPPDAAPRRVELAVLFARGARRRAEIELSHADACREASPWEAVLLGWAKEFVEGGDTARTLYLVRLAELVRHVAHYRAVGEFVDVYESLDDDVDAEGAARRDRVLASPSPAPLVGAKYDEGRPLTAIAHSVHRDIETAVGNGILPRGLRCAVRLEEFERGPGIEIEVVRAPGLWIPDLCQMCVPVAYGEAPPPEGGLTCGHTPSLAGQSPAAHGVLLTLLAIGDVYNRDSNRIEDGAYVTQGAFELATCFDGSLAGEQRETLRSSEEAMRERARRRAAQAGASPSPALPPGAASYRPVEPPRTAP